MKLAIAGDSSEKEILLYKGLIENMKQLAVQQEESHTTEISSAKRQIEQLESLEHESKILKN